MLAIESFRFPRLAVLPALCMLVAETNAVFAANGTAFITTSDFQSNGSADALDATDGSQIWNYGPGGSLSGPAFGATGTVYLIHWSNGVAYLVALNPQNGSLAWSFALTGAYSVNAPVIGTDGTIYVLYTSAASINLMALNPQTGASIWNHSLPAPNGAYAMYGPVFGANGTVYITSNSNGTGSVTALNPQNGNQIWSYAVGSITSITAPVIAANGATYFEYTFNGTGYLMALNSQNGSSLWRYAASTGNFILINPVIAANGTVYLTLWSNGTDYLKALNPQNGNQIWSFAVGNTISIANPVIAANGTVYFVSYASGSDSLMAVNSQNGTKLWSYTVTGSSIINDPVIAPNGTLYVLYVSNAYGYLTALNPQNGNTIWNYEAGIGNFTLNKPVLGADGTVYLTSLQLPSSNPPKIGTGYLTAINSQSGGVEWSYAIDEIVSISGPKFDQYTVTYTVTTSASPSGGGSTGGGGTFNSGTTVTVTATANPCYAFANWTQGGTVVSSSSSYSFTAAGNKTLVANFTPITYTISASSSPAGGGTTSGGGTVNCDSTVTLVATPNPCYAFANWTQGGTVVSSSSSYSFTAAGNETLVANFTPITCTISTSSSPTGGGTTSGGGTVNCGSTVTVCATAGSFYGFINWITNGTVVSSSACCSFTANTNLILVANFAELYSTGDDIPDWWRAQYFGGNGATTNSLSCATCDADGTGQNNVFKYLAGLNPTNPASVFRITSTVPTGANFVVAWQTAGPRTNVVQAANGLTGGLSNSFSDVSGPVIINVVGDTMTNWTDVGGATNRPARFYRVRLGP
jgi:outer membrane protein assembly factor BamB